jgi:hypothetical protein
MGKKGKKTQAGKPKKLTPKDVGKRLDVLVKKLESELEGADLFAPLPPTGEDCAICLVPLSRLKNDAMYQACCGNDFCWACYKENEASINKQNEEKNAGKKLALTCPFCREPQPSSDGYIRQLQARCLLNDHNAFLLMGNVCRNGELGKAKDDLKALDYYIRAVELGSAAACVKIGISYDEGYGGLAVDKERAALFYRVGALGGNIAARHNIGCSEYIPGNHEIGIRHWKIAAEDGYQDSLNVLRAIYNADGKRPGKEFISKEFLESTYRACHEAQMEVASEEREKHRSGK